jgi:predicted ABC-type sugar transport system permease subunit
MSVTLIFLLLIAMAATAYVLVRGVVAMATGGTTLANAQQQQDWMRKRVLYQSIAVILVALILIVAGN